MSGFAGYVATTLVMIGAAIALTGVAVEPAVGMLSAWAIQGLAFRPLVAALEARRDATRAWLGGIWSRSGGMVLLGAASLAGLASPDLPVAYALTMLVLMLVEAAWLHRTRGAEVGNGLEGTHTIG